LRVGELLEDGGIVVPLPPSITHRLFFASKTTPCCAPNTALLSSSFGFSSGVPSGMLPNSTTLLPLATHSALSLTASAVPVVAVARLAQTF
jgi:hypothetical protein